jgi:LytS/YehU family sensor histidine kinase
MLRVEIADSGRGFAPGGNSDDLRSLQNRLHALYGDEGTLVFEALSDRGTRAIIEIPYESTHRGHR